MNLEKEPRAEKIVSREDFGPGTAGKYAYLTISAGTNCESTIHEDQKPLADRTVGFDVLGNYEFVAVCSIKCEEEVKKVVEKDSKSMPSFDRNGFGRA